MGGLLPSKRSHLFLLVVSSSSLPLSLSQVQPFTVVSSSRPPLHHRPPTTISVSHVDGRFSAPEDVDISQGMPTAHRGAEHGVAQH